MDKDGKREPMKIMVVDDEPFIREMMEEFLTLKGHEVTGVGSGEEAIIYLKNSLPDLVLLDIWMPGISGLETLKSLRELHPGLGVVMLSAFGDDETVTEAMEMGANYYLQKPIEFKKLMTILQECQEEK